MSRKKGGRGLASIQDRVEASVKRLKDKIKKHGRRLLTATRNNSDNTIFSMEKKRCI